MTTQIDFTGTFKTDAASAVVAGTIFMTASQGGMKSWEGTLNMEEIEGDMPLLPNGTLTLSDGRSGQILTVNPEIGTGKSGNEIRFQGSGPLA
jgi:hypothetical protein